jgi:putative thiamine transport system permease protein
VLLRAAPWLVLALLTVPVAMGVGLTVLPAFGYLPALGGNTFTLQHWQALFASPGLGDSVLVSLQAGVLTPLLALCVVLMFLAGISGSGLERWIRRLVAPLLAVPHAAAAFGLAFLIAPAGLLSRLLSPELTGWTRPPDALIVNDPWGLSLMLGLLIKEIPFLLLMALAALPQCDPQRRVAMARSLGYGSAVGWLLTVLPALYPLLRLPVYAVIAFASATVEVAMILGPTLPPTLSVAVLQWFSDPDLDWRFQAAAGALLQLGVTASAMLLWRALEGLATALGRRWLASGQRLRGESAVRRAGTLGVWLAAGLSLGGLLALLMNSVAGFWRFPDNLPGAWTLQTWTRTLPELSTPLGNTLWIAAASTVMALVLAVAVLEGEQRGGRRVAPALWLLYVPLVIPQIAFLFGLVVATEFLRWAPDWRLVLSAHLLFVLPYVFLALSEAYRRLDPRWTQLASTLGASPWRCFWQIRLPLLLGPCLTAMAVGIAVSVGQYLATQLPGAGRVPTLTSEAVALASGGNRSIISVWALLQAVVPMLGFALALYVPRFVWRNRNGMRDRQ